MDTPNNILNIDNLVICFAGDSGDGMQLAGNLFSNASAIMGNDIATFPDYPSEIRAPQGTLGGVSGFQVHVGASQVYTSGDVCDVLVAMNPAALKVNKNRLNSRSVILIDTDSFTPRDLIKAQFKTEDAFKELGLKNQVVEIPITSMCLESLKEFELDNKSAIRSKNMMALGLVCWLFNKPLELVEQLIEQKFKNKNPIIAKSNIKVLQDGYNYGHNVHATVATYAIEPATDLGKGLYMDINGNKATAYGLVAAAQNANLTLYLGSYPITPATDILHHLAKLKELGVITVQCEDEIAGCASAIGASFAGCLAVTTTSGPGLCLKSEAINLAVMTELPLVVIDVQRGGPSTGLPTKSEQTDLLQALYGRNGESPLVVLSATSPSNCFDAAYWASKIALEHMTPVILLTDGYIANGATVWKIPDLEKLPAIQPPFVKGERSENWSPYQRDQQTQVRTWAIPGTEGFTHRVGGLEKDFQSGDISSNPENHERMVKTRKAKIEYIANCIPELKVRGNPSAKTLIVGWGGTYGHLFEALGKINGKDKALAMAHFDFINPMPKNTEAILRSYDKILVIEQNSGQLAMLLKARFQGLNIATYNRVDGQPLNTNDLVSTIKNIMED